MTISIENFSMPASHHSDKEAEAQVFRDLEVQQKAWLVEDDGVIVYQYPDGRTVFQRLQAWLYLRPQRLAPTETQTGVEAMSEPVWPRHWATTKYI